MVIFALSIFNWVIKRSSFKIKNQLTNLTITQYEKTTFKKTLACGK